MFVVSLIDFSDALTPVTVIMSEQKSLVVDGGDVRQKIEMKIRNTKCNRHAMGVALLARCSYILKCVKFFVLKTARKVL